MLKRGSKGEDVKNWQRFLNAYLTPDTDFDKLTVDGNFGKDTEGNTKGYQFYAKLTTDGIVGPKTITQAIKDGYKKKIMREINEIIVHITANGSGKTGEKLREQIEAGHRDRGFSEIGYHWLIDKEGTVIKGREEAKVGAHCKAHGKNNGTIGISYDAKGDDNDSNGEYGKYFQSEAQKLAFENLIKEKMAEFNVTKVSGHNKYDNKACPCFDSDSTEFRTAIGLES